MTDDPEIEIDEDNSSSAKEIPSRTFTVKRQAMIEQQDIFNHLGKDFKRNSPFAKGDCEIVLLPHIDVILGEMKNAIEDNSCALQALSGPSGTGKTTTLVLLSQIANEMDILVLGINAFDFSKL